MNAQINPIAALVRIKPDGPTLSVEAFKSVLMVDIFRKNEITGNQEDPLEVQV